MAKDNLVLFTGGGIRYGRSFKRFQHFIACIKKGDKPIMIEKDYVVMSKKMYETLSAKANMAFKKGK